MALSAQFPMQQHLAFCAQSYKASNNCHKTQLTRPLFVQAYKVNKVAHFPLTDNRVNCIIGTWSAE
nr:MAG TPA: hypothetical protein [Caudoviricetes sp.]